MFKLALASVVVITFGVAPALGQMSKPSKQSRDRLNKSGNPGTFKNKGSIIEKKGSKFDQRPNRPINPKSQKDDRTPR